jgi:hypothetical protein
MAKKKVDLSDPVQREAYWTEVASKQLLGRKIVKVRYLSLEESEELGWDGTRCVVIQLDDGTLIFPSQDDEGNGPGVLFTNNKDNSVLPVLY